VDGRLDAARSADVESAMRADPALADRLHGWRAQRDALRAIGRETLDEPVPDRFRNRLQAAARAARIASVGRDGSGLATPASGAAAAAGAPAASAAGRAAGAGAGTGWRFAAGVAIAGAALLGFVAGRGSGRPDGPQPAVEQARAPTAAPPGFVRAAAVAHGVFVPEVRHPVEVAADERGHLVAWLSKRLGARLSAPDLSAQGFELVGGRLLPGEHGPSAQLMYQDASGIRVTLYAARRDDADAADAAFRFGQDGAIQSFYWIDGGLGWVLSGELPRERLSGLATEVYRALDAAPR
jgi:anti-sigma factor RsiW